MTENNMSGSEDTGMFGVNCQKSDKLGVVTLYGPENPISGRDSETLLWQFEDALEDLEYDDKIWAVLVTSNLKLFLPEYFELGADSFGEALGSITKPVICAIQESAFGTGFEFILCCDISVCHSKSLFSMSHLKDGAIPRDGGTQRLPRIVGQGRALELLLTCRTFGASEAQEIGLVQYVSDHNSLDLGLDISRQIINNAPIAVKYIKEAVKSGLNMPLSQGLVLEADLSVILQSTKDRSEGLSSFFNKRNPKYKGH